MLARYHRRITDCMTSEVIRRPHSEYPSRTNRIMQPLEAAVFATIDRRLNPYPVSIFPTRFQWCMCLPLGEKKSS